MKKWVLLLIFISAASCSEPRDYEYYGDVQSSPGGLALTDPDEHRGGWGRSDCFTCHNVEKNIHRRPGSTVDADAILERAVSEGVGFCFTCHSDNGV